MLSNLQLHLKNDDSCYSRVSMLRRSNGKQKQHLKIGDGSLLQHDMQGTVHVSICMPHKLLRISSGEESNVFKDGLYNNINESCIV